MYQDFRIVAIAPDARRKTITIESSFDIDADSVNDSTIQLYDKSTLNHVIVRLSTAGKKINLELVDWPVPNLEYILVVQGLKTVLGDKLVSGVRRTVVFESSIASELNITYPAYNEVINDLKIEWEEIPPVDSAQLVGLYFVQISSDSGFYNLVREIAVTGRNYLDLLDLPNGQYYVRGRVEGEISTAIGTDETGAPILKPTWQCGLWSETVTFVVDSTSSSPDLVPGEEVDPVYQEEIEIMTLPQSGVTASSFLIEFDSQIDPSTLDGIMIIRRDV